MLKGIEKMERSARYIVRLQKNGQYMVVMSRPEWANREIPGFATEAEANDWVAQDKRLWQAADPFRTPAGRRWRGV